MHLVITTYGCSLRKHKGRFKLSTETSEQYFSAHHIESITLTTACSLSTDAILLALEHEIPLLIMDRKGQPLGRLWSPRYGSIARIRRQQLRWADTLEGTHWIIEQLLLKAQRQLALLQQLQQEVARQARRLKSCKAGIQAQMASLQAWKGKLLNEAAPHLRPIEGNISRQYFPCLSACLPKRYQFAQRTRQPAVDLFNALLNYLYGMLYHESEAAIIGAGLDPYLPFMHRDGYGKPAFVYDFIEGFRPWADEVAVHLCLSKAFKKSHVREQQEGLWLSSTGRALAITHFQAFMAERPPGAGKKVTRHALIRQHAQALAQELLKAAEGEDTWGAGEPS